MSPDIVKVSPAAIRWKLSLDFLRDDVDHDAWRLLPRAPVHETEKYRSIVQRHVENRLWEDTPLFQHIYEVRIKRGEAVRGCQTLGQLLAQYYGRVDALYRELRDHGYQRVVRGEETTPIPVYIGHDDEILIGNQGNHRLAMAQLLHLDYVIAQVVGRHPESRLDPETVEPVPDLPASVRAIPAMTTEAERRCYYRLTREMAGQGAIVELGAWLGASSAYIAAGVRDSGVPVKAQIYDRFVWKPASHDKKAGGPLGGSQLEAFQQHLGPLLAHVEVHAAEVSTIAWRGGPVALLVCDAPKRIPEIASVLTTFADALRPGALMAWQDFAYFPSYDIPAAIIRLGDHVEFVEAVYPGTTAVFRVVKAWRPEDVSASALAVRRWTPDAVETAWAVWGARLPAPMQPRFACGAAMFLCDLGATDRAQRHLRSVIARDPEAVLPKWRYLIAERANLMQRYRPLVEEVARCA